MGDVAEEAALSRGLVRQRILGPGQAGSIKARMPGTSIFVGGAVLRRIVYGRSDDRYGSAELIGLLLRIVRFREGPAYVCDHRRVHTHGPKKIKDERTESFRSSFYNG